MKLFSDYLVAESAKSMDVEVRIDKNVSDQPQGRFYLVKRGQRVSEIFPFKSQDSKDPYFVIYSKRAGQTRTGVPKSYVRKGNAWIDNNSKQASKYINDLLHILEREFYGDLFF